MSIYAHIKRCLELSDRDIASAVGDRRLAKALLDQLAKVSRPGDGAPKLLLVFARLASAGVDWIDGALRVEMVGDGDVTVVEVLSELGLGMHERVFPSFKMSVPLEEFARAVERVPHMIAPLTIAATSERRLVLTAIADGEEDEEEEGASPSVSIGDESLYTGERRRASKDRLVAVKDPAAARHPPSGKPPRKSSRPMMEAVRPKVIAAKSGKTLRPMGPVGDVPMTGTHERIAPPPPNVPGSRARIAAAPAVASPQASAPRIAPAPTVPRAPPLPRTDERTPEPGPVPGSKRTVVARVPLTKVQVPRGSRPPAAAAKAPSRPSKPPKRPSIKPAATKGTPSKPPGRPSKAPPSRSGAPKSTRAGRTLLSEPPDEEGIDSGWDEDT